VGTYRERAWEIAMGQYGYVTTNDAKEAGIPAIELAKLAARGRLRNVAYGLYHFDDMPPTRYDQFYEAVKRVGGDAHLTGDAVLALHELALVNPRRIRVGTTRRTRSRFPNWLEVVRDASAPEEIVVVEQIPTTTVARAIRDARKVVMPSRLIEAIPAAVNEGLITETEAEKLRVELEVMSR